MNATVVSSLVSQSDMTQAGLVYLCTALSRAGCDFNIVDLGGQIEYFDVPDRLRTGCDSPSWMSPDSIRNGEWMDCYLPPTDQACGLVLFSSLFSPDVVFHARYSHNIKTANPRAFTAIGGSSTGVMVIVTVVSPE